MVLDFRLVGRELEAERETDTDPGVVYEDAEAFKAALRAARP